MTATTTTTRNVITHVITRTSLITPHFTSPPNPGRNRKPPRHPHRGREPPQRRLRNGRLHRPLRGRKGNKTPNPPPPLPHTTTRNPNPPPHSGRPHDHDHPRNPPKIRPNGHRRSHLRRPNGLHLLHLDRHNLQLLRRRSNLNPLCCLFDFFYWGVFFGVERGIGGGGVWDLYGE